MRDITEKLARRLDDRLEAGEQVLAGVALDARGTTSAALSGGARAAVGVASVAPDGDLAEVRRQHESIGVNGVRFYLLLTDARLVLVRRNAIGRAAEVVLAVPVGEVDSIAIGNRSSTVTVNLADGRTLDLETPKAVKFLPPVYLELPARLEAAKTARG